MHNQHTSLFQKIHILPFWTKLFLVCAIVLQSCGFSVEGTYGAWQISAAIEGNAVTTAGLTETFETIVVTEDDLASDKVSELANPTSWFFYNDQTDTIDNTLGTFVEGPETPLVGDGSAQISVTGSQRRNLATYLFSGTKLSDITALSFTTYNPSLGNGGSSDRSAYLNFNVTFDGVDSWQSRLTFVPSTISPINQDMWKEWDAIGGGDALWGWSQFAKGPDNIAATSDDNSWPDGSLDPLRTWSDLVSSFPEIAIRTTDSWLGLRVGEPYADGYTENIDSFTFGKQTGFNSHIVTYDFEPSESIHTSETVIVSPSLMGSWTFAPENTVGDQTGLMVAGPGMAPLGDGSAQFKLNAANQGEILVTNEYAGTALATIVALEYSTYRTTGDAALAPALSFEFDNDVTDADSNWRGRMVYEPYHTQTVQTGAWQTWDTKDDAAGTGSGSWWGSPNALSTLDEACPQANPCTWTEVLGLYPNAGIRDTGAPTAGLLLFKAGSGWTVFEGSVDVFKIGVQSGLSVHTTTYDFEPEALEEPEIEAGDVVINEIMWMGSDPSDGGSTADEWIELRNMTNVAIDLSGWTISDLGTNANPDITIPSGMIPANGYFLISNYESDDESSAINDAVMVDHDTVDIQLLNSGEKLELRTADATLIDETPSGEWAAGDNTGSDRKSMERNAVPGSGALTESWHTCIDSGCTSSAFWDNEGDNYGTPKGANLSSNDPTMPDYVDQDWSHTIGWEPDENDVTDDSEHQTEETTSGGGSSVSVVVKPPSTATSTATGTDAIEEIPEDTDMVEGPEDTGTTEGSQQTQDTSEEDQVEETISDQDQVEEVAEESITAEEEAVVEEAPAAEPVVEETSPEEVIIPETESV